MRHGVATCVEPKEATSLYIRCMYHEFFYGPFRSEDACSEAIASLDKADPYWDYDCFCIHYGAEPLPKDFAYGFPFVDEEMRRSIEAKARPKGKPMPKEI